MNGATGRDSRERQIVTIVLGFGHGARLFPLTAERAKAALPFLGQYRLIDVALSQCLHAGLRRIYVLTQFNSVSLNRHVMQTYRPGRLTESTEFVEILAAEQTPESQQWYRSPTDAIRRAWRHIESGPFSHVLILPGDHVVQIPLRDLLAFHFQTEADLTLVVTAADEECARTRGVVKIAGSSADATRASDWRVVAYAHEPRADTMKDFRLQGEKPYLVATGLFLFARDVLEHLLAQSAGLFDFGLEVLPSAIATFRVFAYRHRGYWDDVSTIRAYYEAQMRMLDPIPPFVLEDPVRPLYTRPRYLPPATIRASEIIDSVIAEGSILEGARLRRSILGLRSRVGRDVYLEGVIAFGASFFPSAEDVARDRARSEEAGEVPIGIGEGTIIRRAILDRNVRIGAHVRIVNAEGRQHADGPNYVIREGIVIIPKNAVIPDGSII